VPLKRQLGTKDILTDLRRINTGAGAGSGSVKPHAVLGPKHSDSDTANPAEGAMILGDSTPEWNILLHPAAAGYALVTGATTFAWDQTPTWTGSHTWNAGAGDSPSLILITGSTDTFTIWANNDVAGDSDLVIQLPATDSDSRLEIWDATPTIVAYIDADGNADFDGHGAIGATAGVNAYRLLDVQDTAIDTDSSFFGIFENAAKTAGASDENDTWTGMYNLATLNQAAGTIGHLTGNWSVARISDGQVGTSGAARILRGGYFVADVDAGIVYDDAIGVHAYADHETGATVNGNLAAVYAAVDNDGTTTGSAILVWMDALSNVDYGLYCIDDVPSIHRGAATFGNTTAPAAQVDIDQSSATGAIPALMVDQADLDVAAILISQNSGDGTIIGVQFDVTGTPNWGWDETNDYIEQSHGLALNAGDLHILGAGSGIIHVDGVAAGQILLANGTRYIPAAANTNLPIAPGARGHIIRAEAGPVWASYDAKTNAQILVGDGTDINSVAVSGDATLTNAGAVKVIALQNYAVQDHLPVDGEVLTWVNANLRWEPVANAGGIPVGGRGHIMRGEAGPVWASYNAATNGAVLIGDGTDVISDTTPTIAGLTTFTSGWLTAGSGDLNGQQLIIDTDGDSYLVATGDDVVDIVLATASGEFGVNVNGADAITFTDNSLNVVSGSVITMADDTSIQLASAGGQINFDSTPATDEIHVKYASLVMETDAGADILWIRNHGDVESTGADIYAEAQLGLAADDNVHIFIDAENLSTARYFAVWKNAEFRSSVNAVQLFTVPESGIVDCSFGGIRTITATDNVDDIEPTDAQLDTAFGTPATVGEGFIGIIDDNNAETRVWLCVAVGSTWWHTRLYLAP
jgi:hypothetical protein